MDDKRTSKQRGAVIAVLFVLLLLLPTLYVASSGPAARLASHSHISWETYEVAYYPIMVAIHWWPWAVDALSRYQAWCGGAVYLEADQFGGGIAPAFETEPSEECGSD
jgi:hypothetical protein